MTVFVKVVGYALVIVGLGIMTFNGSPRHWEKGTWLKHILIDVGGVIVACGGMALANISW